MRHWAVLIPAERYAQERLVASDALPVDALPAPDVPPGAQVVLIADTVPPVVFGFGEALRDGRMRYTRRLFDAPLPVDGLALPADGLAAGPMPADVFAALAARAGPAEAVRTWLVGVDLPIEADTPAEAVRRYWAYVRDLGPRELPAYVAPIGDELAIQAYVLGEEAALDPEED